MELLGDRFGGAGVDFSCDQAATGPIHAGDEVSLAALPPETLVYCGHDYTLENCEFAVAVAPDNRRFRDRLAEVQKAVESGQLTVPSTITQERAANIFLQADNPQVKAALGMPGAQPHKVFAELRRHKDLFD